MTMPVAKVLDQAATWLEAHGWTQEAYGLMDGVPWDPDVTYEREPECCCALGAIALVGGFKLGEEGLICSGVELLNWLGVERPEDPDVPWTDSELWEYVVDRVSFWNDDSDRTKQDVVTALRGAAQWAQRLGR